MSRQTRQCYDRQLFQRFLDEQFDETEEAAFLAHLGSCQKCQVELARISGHAEIRLDIEQLADGFDDETIDDTPSEVIDARRDLQAMRKLLAPTDNPQMLGRLGSYEVCGIIGRGSAGIVVKALDPRLNRFVAIKVLAPVYSNNGSARRRFEREGRSIASVKDAHVIPIYTVEDFQGLPYIVMQYMPDGSLHKRLEEQGPLTTSEVVCIGMQIAKGLSAAHERGIVHRDVKPANVLLESGVDRAMVTDFGLARVVDDATMTRSGAISGTPQYMSPEQARGESIDPRSDLFSLGSVMYTACTGRSPFRSETVFGVIKRVCETHPRPIRETNPEIDEWLAAFIARLHNKRPENRFESAAQVAEILGRELAHLQAPTMVTKPERSWWEHRRSPWLALGSRFSKRPAALLAVVAITLFSLFALQASNWFGSPGEKHANIGDSPELTRFDTTVETTIDVKPGGTLALRTNLGAVNVLTHDKPRVDLRLLHSVAAEDRESAEKILAAMKVNYEIEDPERHGIEYHMESEYDAMITAIFPIRDLTEREIESTDNLEELKELLLLRNVDCFRDVVFELKIPRDFNLDLATDEGRIEVHSDINGWVTLTTDKGEIDLHNVSGQARVVTASGNISIGNVGDQATLVARNGSIDVMAVEGTCHVESDGHIDIGRSRDSLNAMTKNGGITIRNAAESVEAQALAGPVTVNFVDQPSRPSSLNAGSGVLKIGLVEGIDFNVKATPEDGYVTGPFIDGMARKFRGNLNCGGQDLAATIQDGSIVFALVQEVGETEAPRQLTDGQSDFQLGLQLHMEGKLDEAVKFYNQVTDSDPQKPNAVYNLGCIYAQQSRVDESIKALQHAVQLGFDDLDLLRTDRDLDQVRDDKRLMRLIGKLKDRHAAEQLLTKAQIHMLDEAYGDAAKVYRKVLEVVPDHTKATFQLGYALHMDGKIDQAIRWHRRAAESDEYRALANYNLGCVYAMKGENDKAFKYLYKALDAGFLAPRHVRQDSDLDNIRDDKRYERYLKKLEQAVEKRGRRQSRSRSRSSDKH